MQRDVSIPWQDHLAGSLSVPDDVRGAVIFAHGSGSSRYSPRNRFVAERLNANGFATLLLDLLTPDEERRDRYTTAYRFDIALLGVRLTAAADWVRSELGCPDGSVGCFGASTGSAAAFIAAAERPRLIGAVVSRGGRPDLAGTQVLQRVRTPTLLVVGGLDHLIRTLNRDAVTYLKGERELVIIPGATHLFEEPGALANVADLAVDWFERHLAHASLGATAEPAPPGP
jgi:putative phosphoribosyl transferase